jgi:hypothetical protein
MKILSKEELRFVMGEGSGCRDEDTCADCIMCMGESGYGIRMCTRFAPGCAH